MQKFLILIVSALFASCYAKPGLFNSLALANAPLYAAGGSGQLDVRQNYDGSLSSYANAPFGYAGPFASRYVAAGTPTATFSTYAAAVPTFGKYSPQSYSAYFPAAAAASYAATPFGAAALNAAPPHSVSYATPYGTSYTTSLPYNAASYATPAATYSLAAQFAAPLPPQFAAQAASPLAASAFGTPAAAPATAAFATSSAPTTPVFS